VCRPRARVGSIWLAGAPGIADSAPSEGVNSPFSAPLFDPTRPAAPRASSGTHLVRVAVAALLLVLFAPASASHAAAADHGDKPKIKEFLLPTPDARPLGITVGPDRKLWFVEFLGNKVGRITPSGRVTEFPIPTAGSTPDAIITGPDGNLWFTEVAGNKIGRITPEGVITEFPVRTPDSRATVIAAGPDGNLWFTERGRPHPAGALDVAKVGRITTEGVITEFPVPTLGARPLGITGGRDGNVWFTESMVDKVARITPEGVVTEFPLPNPCPVRCQPHEITSGPDGTLWFTEAFGNRIGRMTTNGEVTEFDLPHPNSGPNLITRGPARTLIFAEDRNDAGHREPDRRHHRRRADRRMGHPDVRGGSHRGHPWSGRGHLVHGDRHPDGPGREDRTNRRRARTADRGLEIRTRAP
jgi:virginiamycin B lyase